MQNFQGVYTQVKLKLGRCLNDQEIEFLRWIHEQHILELAELEKSTDQLSGLKELN